MYCVRYMSRGLYLFRLCHGLDRDLFAVELDIGYSNGSRCYKSSTGLI